MTSPIKRESRTNRTVAEFCDRAKNPSEDFFLVEGRRFVLDLDISLLKAVLILDKDKYIKETELFLKRNIPVYYITRPVAEKISSTVNVQEIMAFASKQKVPQPKRLVLLDRIQDPGNMGTIIRSAAAFGFGVIYSEGSANPFSTKAVRSSAGTIQQCFLKNAEISLTREARELKKLGFKIFSAELDQNAETPDSIKNVGKIAIIIGNEASGVSAKLSEEADQKIRIPLTEKAESLNAAAAASILMYCFRP